MRSGKHPLLESPHNETCGSSTASCLQTLAIKNTSDIKQFAKATLTEATPSLLLTCATLPFTAKSAWFNPLLTSSLSLSLNTLLRLPDYAQWEAEFERVCKTKIPLSAAARSLRSLVFAFLFLKVGDILLHESGHALAAVSLFKHPDIDLTITPGFLKSDGTTLFYNNELTALGGLIGNNASNIICSLAGTSSSTLVALLSLVIATALPTDYLELKSHLRFMTLVDMVHNLIYSLSPYYGHCEDFNDFCQLQDRGIPPYSIFITLLLATIGLQAVFAYIDTRYSDENTHKDETRDLLVFIEDSAEPNESDSLLENTMH